MKHKERIEIAKKISDKLVKEYNNKVSMVGIFGSTARNEDVETSDLELICSIKGDFKSKDVAFIHSGIFIHVWIASEKKIIEEATTVNFNWPMEAGNYKAFKVIYDDKNFAKKISEKIKGIHEKEFIEAIEYNLPIIYEELNAIKSAIKRKGLNNRNLNALAKGLVFHTVLHLSLLNKTPLFGSNYRVFIEAFNLKKLPPNYEKDARKILEFKTKKELVKLSEKFVYDFVNFLRKNGIKFKEIEDIDGVKF